MNDSRDLITSILLKYFHKNPNTGHMINSSSSQTSIKSPSPSSSQPSLLKSFIGEDFISQKITSQIQGGIAAAASSPGGHIEIKCIFDVIR
ncbi:MAG TPA: hypothetical protein VJ729_10825 [Nitrososphaeraceae archaeon]|nr:hypothetical protein [Nitrososphaeraceae archaeon]